MTGRRLRTTGVFVAEPVLLSGTAGPAPAASLSGAEPAATGPSGGSPDPVPDFVATVPDRLAEFVDSIADGNPGTRVSEPVGGWW
ncbi:MULTISPECIES: hypothetical protein [Haloarcula]|uniref:hypothetical protein n=1 Tax=Haloarcula TaxID=2237 RepID=UPI0023EBBD6C|nr:hypothetical protein [Halomicroarcula sp. XH51]